MRKLMALALVLVFSAGLTTTVMAAAAAPRGVGLGSGVCREIGLPGAGLNFFWDAAGNLLSREVVEANLNNAVAVGDITAAQRDLLLERYDFCVTVGGGANGVRCGGLGRRLGGGQGFGRAW